MQDDRTLEHELAARTRALEERVKELSCLYEVSSILDRGELLRESLEEVVRVLPDGFQYPGLAEAAIRVDALEVRTSEDAETAMLLSAPIDVDGRRAGAVTVWYREPNDFLREEGRLLAAIASRVGATLARRELEARLHHAQKMDAVGRLAGGIAHELNNLLTVMDSSCAFLDDDLPAGDVRRADVEEIRKAVARATTLTRQLLAFGRRAVVQPRLIAPTTLVRELEKVSRKLLGEDVRLVVELDETAGVVRIDRGQLEQVLLELFVNAREAMATGGTLTVRTRAEASRDGAVVCIEVVDTGCGMAEEVRGRVFEPFFSTKQGGTGLGLATAYGIVKQSGGSLEVESDEGQGARFVIRLPQVSLESESEAQERATKDEAMLPGLRRETVLVVEDEDGVRAAARRILHRAGYRVIEARSGHEALLAAAAHRRPLDLLVTDVVMPGMSGREVAEHLEQVQPGLPVLYVSGYIDDAVLRHGVQRTEVAFLEKPFTPKALLEAVRGAIAGRAEAVLSHLAR